MANEPEREIEKQLRAGAKLRRDAAGAPRPMPPDLRQKLQAEVARQHSRQMPRRGFWSQLFTVSWPRLAVATATIVLLGLLLSHFLSGSPQTPGGAKFAFNDFKKTTQSDVETAAEKAPKPAPVAPMSEIPASTKLDAAADDSRNKAPALNTPAPSPPVPALAKDESGNAEISRSRVLSDRNPDVQNAQSSLRRGGSASNNQIATFASAAPAVSSADRKPAAIRSETALGAAAAPTGVISQAYAQVKVADALKPQQQLRDTGVLDSFRLEQTGNQIRVIDRDGSVYDGSVEPTVELAKSSESFAAAGNGKAEEADKESRQLREGAALALQPGSAPATVSPPAVQSRSATQNYSFSVRGTNRTLQQLVVFTGRLENTASTSRASPAPVPAATFGAGAKISGGARQFPVSNLRVSGHAVVGTTNQLDIIAEPTNP